MSWIERLLVNFLVRRGYVVVRNWDGKEKLGVQLMPHGPFDHSRYKC